MVRGEKNSENSVSVSLERLSDEELALLCSNCGEAVSVLISRYIKLIWKKAYAYSNDYLDAEDLTQEGLLALLKAANSFDVSRGVRFSSYCEVCVSNRIKSAVIKNSKLTNEVLDTADVSEEDNETPENICLEKEVATELYYRISSLLSEKEWEVFKLYLDDMSYIEISSKLGVSEKSVDNAVFRVRRKLRAIISPSHFTS